MSIRGQLRIAAVLPAVVGALIAALLWISWGEVERARAGAESADASTYALSELNALTQELLLYGGPRVCAQLIKQRAALAATLAKEPFFGAEERVLWKALQQGQADLLPLLTLLVEGGAVSREQIAGALLVKVQDLRFKARKLASGAHREVVRVQRRVDSLVLGALATLTLLSFALLTWASRRLIRGLERLDAGIRRVAGENFAQDLPVERRDELGRLSGAFNDMTRRLRESRALVDERTAALDRRSAELEAAVADLESFSYSVSHDLRAPLRAIDGFAAILREDYAPRLDAEGVRLLGVVSDNARRMGQLIDDILAFSRAGRRDLQRTTLDMEALVREVWQDLAARRADRAVELHLSALPPAWGDPGAIRQVWQNLLDNALKFSKGRSPALIEVRGQREAGQSHYAVADNGVGFDPAYAGKLFGLFQRLHGREEFEGTGVGLAIVKRYVDKHGGRVQAEGRLGAGATFRFTLPGGDDGP